MKPSQLVPAIVVAAGLATACGGAKPAADVPTDSAGVNTSTVAAAVRADSACARGAVAPGSLPALVRLYDPPSLVRLPSSLWRRELNEPRSAVWVAPDLSYMLIVAMDTVPDVAGVAGGEDITGVMRRLREPRSSTEIRCRLDVDGRVASLLEAAFVDASGADTVFAVHGALLVRPGLAFAASGITPSRSMRDSLVAVIASVRFAGRR